MTYEHREAENALDRAESAINDAQQALSALVDPSDIEDELGCLSDTLRDCHSDAEALLTTDLEDAEDAIRQLVSDLGEACTDASSLYNRL